MKLIVAILTLLLISSTNFAQEKGDPIPLSNFSMRLAKDSSLFSKEDLQKGKPLIFMLFSPTCGHCQHQTEILEENIAHFKGVQIVMITWLSFDKIKTFYQDFHLADYSQITIGADPNNRDLLEYYKVTTYPKLIAYDKDKKYIASFNGNYNIQDVWEVFK